MKFTPLDLLFSAIEIFSFCMLFTALRILTARTIQQMISYYRWQCLGLVLVTCASVIEYMLHGGREFIQWFILIPVLMAIFLEPILVYATIEDDVPSGKRLLRLFTWFVRKQESQQTMCQVIPVWLRSRRSKRGGLAWLAVALALMALAFVVAFRLPGHFYLPASAGPLRADQVLALGRINASVLAVSLSLLLMGLSVMTNTEDVISLVIGLQVMAQGIYLAAIRSSTRPSVAIFFIFGLFVFSMVTPMILVFLLPSLHHRSGALDVNQQNLLKG